MLMWQTREELGQRAGALDHLVISPAWRALEFSPAPLPPADGVSRPRSESAETAGGPVGGHRPGSHRCCCCCCWVHWEFPG